MHRATLPSIRGAYPRICSGHCAWRQSPLQPATCPFTSPLRCLSSVARDGNDSVTPATSPPPSIDPFRKQLKQESKAKRAANRQRSAHQGGDDAEAARLAKWELTVGIEVHAQLDTEKKLFSRASTSMDEKPNTNVALFDLAMPGSQPIFQKATLIPALRAAMALNCQIQRTSRFDRKHYFYQDQPAGYQITQYYEPYAKNGSIRLHRHDGIARDDVRDGEDGGVTIDIQQMQMEQDTAKSTELPGGVSLLDYNRVSRPLIEIITRPQIHSPEMAAACVRKIQGTLMSVGAVATGMEMGGLRADVNVSVRRKDAVDGALGQRTEIKNLSSFKAIENAVRAERNRQITVIEAGGVVEGETRGWTIGTSETKRLRSKEGEVDYRYMPDPDLGPVIIGDDLLHALTKRLPLLPDAQLSLLTETPLYNLKLDDAKALVELDNGARLDYYLDTVDICSALGSIGDTTKSGQTVANWVLHELGGLFSTSEFPIAWSPTRVPPEALAQIIHLLTARKVTSSSAKKLLAMVFDGDDRPIHTIVATEGMELTPLSKAEYVTLASAIMEENAPMVAQIQDSAKTNEKQALGKIGWFVGQMVRRGEKGKVEAQKAGEVLKEMLLRD